MPSVREILEAFKAAGTTDAAIDAIASLELSADDLLDLDPAEVWGVADDDAERIAGAIAAFNSPPRMIQPPGPPPPPGALPPMPGALPVAGVAALGDGVAALGDGVAALGVAPGIAGSAPGGGGGPGGCIIRGGLLKAAMAPAILSASSSATPQTSAGSRSSRSSSDSSREAIASMAASVVPAALKASRISRTEGILSSESGRSEPAAMVCVQNAAASPEHERLVLQRAAMCKVGEHASALQDASCTYRAGLHFGPFLVLSGPPGTRIAANKSSV